MVLVAAAIAAVLPDTSPAGWAPADAVFRAVGAGGLAFASSYARRWTWFVLAVGTNAGTGGDTLALSLAAATLALAIVGGFASRRVRPIGAAVGGLAFLALVQLPTDLPAGLPTAIAAATCLPTVASFWRGAPLRVVRPVTYSLLVAGAVMVVFSSILLVSAVSGRKAVARAIDLTRDAIEQVRNGDQDEAARLFQRAADEFDRANNRVAGFWTKPARLVPVVGHHAAALDVATTEGSNLSRAAGVAALDVDLDALALDDGSVNIALVKRFAPQLVAAADAVEQAGDALSEADSPWLLSPLDGPLERFEDEMREALPDIRRVADAASAAPALLGEDGRRRYLVVFITPAELRGLGGFIGSFAQIDVVDGEIALTRTGRPDELNRVLRAGEPALSGPLDYLDRYSRYMPETFFQDVTFSPDFPSVAQVIEELYPQAGGAELDGVLALDPAALAALLRLTGPVQLGEVRLTAADAEQFLVHDQYLVFADDPERRDLLDDALRETFDRLFTLAAPSPRALVDAFRPVIEEDRFIMWATRSDEQALFERLGVDGSMPEPDDGDFLAITTQNSANNKIDYFLERDLSYDVGFDPESGRVTAALTVTLTNNAPASGLPDAVIGNNDRGLPFGTNKLLLSVYTPHELLEATVDGMPTSTQRGIELGHRVYSVFVTLPARSSAVVELDLDGFVLPGDEYALRLAAQPTVIPEELELVLTGSDGWELTSLSTPDEAVEAPIDDPRTTLLELAKDQVITAEFDRR